MLFGQKKPEGKTVLLLDVDNGSVGAALVRLEVDKAPRLFGETREYMRAPATRDTQSLMQAIGTSARTVLGKAAEVAGRLRNSSSLQARDAGVISEAKIFLSAPWGLPDLAGEPVFVPPMEQLLRESLAGPLAGTPVTLHTAAGGMLGGARQVLPYEESYLLCLIGSEVSELLLVSGGLPSAYATAPFGRHTVVRTLRTHGGLTDEEAHSLFALRGAPHEAAAEASRHFAEGFADAAGDILTGTPAAKVFVLAHGNSGEWFARALSASPAMSELFPRGGVVRALGARHVSPFLTAHSQEPDLMLGLEALFTNDSLKW
ncbi:MAG: hypothetical protein V4474_01320 [Patescibacteria group bacterium]